MVIALEFIEGLLLIRADDIGDVLRSVQVAHASAGMLREDMISDRMNQVGFSQSDAPIDKERVIGGPGMLGDLQRGGARELIGLSGDEAVETEFVV